MRRQGREDRSGYQGGFGILQVLVVAAVASLAVYLLQSQMVNSNRFQAGLVASEDLHQISTEAQLATRNFNFCAASSSGPGIIQVSGPLQPPGSNGPEAIIAFKYPLALFPFLGAPPLVSGPIKLPNVTVKTVQLVPVLQVGIPQDNNTQYLAEVRITGSRNSNATGGLVTEVFPMYVLLNSGGGVQTCFSTEYMKPLSTATPAPTPPLTYEDQLCNVPPVVTVTPQPSGSPPPSPTPTPTGPAVIGRFDPWPANPPNATSSYCH